MKKTFIAILFLIGNFIYSQTNSDVLSFEEFLGYVKTAHPLTKQANLKISEAQATVSYTHLTLPTSDLV